MSVEKLAMTLAAILLATLIITIGSCQATTAKARYEYLQNADARIAIAEKALEKEFREEEGFRWLWDRVGSTRDKEREQLLEYRYILMLTRLQRYQLAASLDKNPAKTLEELPIQLPKSKEELEAEIERLKAQFQASSR